MKKVKELKSATKTEIFKFVAKKFGNENLKNKVYDFLKNHSVYGEKVAYKIAYFNEKLDCSNVVNLPVSRIVEMAKHYKNQGSSNYSKILIEGNSNIYWASPVYGHSDYNKSIAISKNENTLKLMQLVNCFLNK